MLLAFNWKAPQNEPTPMWVSHVLRREAQRVILPRLDEFLSGNYHPQDRDELDALLGASQFANRPLTPQKFTPMYFRPHQIRRGFATGSQIPCCLFRRPGLEVVKAKTPPGSRKPTRRDYEVRLGLGCEKI